MFPLKHRKFGIEFEFSTSIRSTTAILSKWIEKTNANGRKVIKQNNYVKSDDIDAWYIKLDSSTECEVTTPVLSMNNWYEVEEFIDAATVTKSLGTYTKASPRTVKQTRRDGLHVHIDARDIHQNNFRDLRLKNIAYNWIKYENLLIKMFGMRRRQSRFAKRLANSKSIEKLNDMIKSPRLLSKTLKEHYLTMSLSTHKTIEFRSMEGTLDKIDLHCWVNLLLKFVHTYGKNLYTGKDLPNDGSLKNPDLMELVDDLHLSKKMVDWIEYRILKARLMDAYEIKNTPFVD